MFMTNIKIFFNVTINSSYTLIDFNKTSQRYLFL